MPAKGWWRAFGLDDTGYVPLEAEASLVRDVALGLVPGLLQTEEYMRAIFGSRLDPVTPEMLEANMERITLHVLPAGVGARPALSGGFTLLSFADLGLPDIAYAEHPLGSTRIAKKADAIRAARLFDRLRSLALDPDDSVALIQRAAAETGVRAGEFGPA